jgi:hypothetical protein
MSVLEALEHFTGMVLIASGLLVASVIVTVLTRSKEVSQ